MNDRKEYAYVLCVNGKITQLIVKEWSTEEEMKIQSSAMWAAARLFKKPLLYWCMSIRIWRAKFGKLPAHFSGVAGIFRKRLPSQPIIKYITIKPYIIDPFKNDRKL